MRLPEGRGGQALAVAMLLAVLAVLWLGVAAPLLAEQSEAREALAQRRAVLARMQALADRLPAFEAALAEDRAPRPALLPGTADGVAAAALQEALQGLGREAGVSFESIAPQAASQAGHERRIVPRVATVAPYAALVGLMARIEAARPGMLIEDLQLHAAAIVPLGEAAVTRPLDASFAVVGFRAASGAT